MGQGNDELIRTPRLELVSLIPEFVAALVGGDHTRAGRVIGAVVSPWFASEPAHFVQLSLAQARAASPRYAGLGRAIILIGEAGRRRVIGSIGFHGPPDGLGRLEIGCRIHPAHRGKAYGAEATTALLDWATDRFGITRFLLAVPSRREAAELVPIEIEASRGRHSEGHIDALADLLEGSADATGR